MGPKRQAMTANAWPVPCLGRRYIDAGVQPDRSDETGSVRLDNADGKRLFEIAGELNFEKVRRARRGNGERVSLPTARG